jgi:hypothetical protein
MNISYLLYQAERPRTAAQQREADIQAGQLAAAIGRAGHSLRHAVTGGAPARRAHARTAGPRSAGSRAASSRAAGSRSVGAAGPCAVAAGACPMPLPRESR